LTCRYLCGVSNPIQLELFAFGARVTPRPDLGEGCVLVRPGPMAMTGPDEEINAVQAARLLGLAVATVRAHPHRYGARQMGAYCRLRFPLRKVMELRGRQRMHQKAERRESVIER
jgi:hypothetical protein